MGKAPRPIIDGTAFDDHITLGYVDADGESVSNGSENVFGYGGNDRISGGGGHDFIYGGEGNDTINGGNGNDKLYGEDGDDEIRGGAGNDRLYGGAGNDDLQGGSGDDQMSGGQGDDTLFGGSGNDEIHGNKGNNILDGGSGDDTITSGDQSSTLDGGGDDDTLVLRMNKGGDHEATGGAGADEFQFIYSANTAISECTITDFELGIDNFTVEGVDDSVYLSIVGAGAVTSAGGGADTLLTLTTGDTILFEDITEAEFEAHYGL